MNKTIVVVAFILISLQAVAQEFTKKEEEDYEKIGQILNDNGVIRYRWGGIETKEGFYIFTIEKEIRKMSDVRPSRVFLYTPDKKFSEVLSLKGYIIEDYSEKRNQLLIGKMDVGDRSVLCGKHYTYDLGTKKLTLQYDLKADGHKDMFGSVRFTESKDSIIVHGVDFYTFVNGDRITHTRNVIRKLK